MHGEIGDPQLDLAGGEARVYGVGAARDDLAGDGDDAFGAHRFDGGEMRAVALDDALGDAGLVAQVNEQQVAVVPLAVDPARKARFGADMFAAQLAAIVGSIVVHGRGA